MRDGGDASDQHAASRQGPSTSDQSEPAASARIEYINPPSIHQAGAAPALIRLTGRGPIEILRRQWNVVVFTFLLTVGLALAVVTVHHGKYTALSHVLLVSDSSGRDPAVAGMDLPTIATGSSVLNDVRAELQLRDSVNDLRRSVSARIPPRSSLMTIAVQNADARGAVAINNAITDAFVKHYWKVAKLRYDDVTRRLEHAVGDARVRRDLLERRLEVASAGAVYVGSQASLDAAAARFAEIEQLVGLARGQYAADTANLQADLNPPMAFSHAARYEMLRNSADFRETEALIAHDAGQYTTLRSGVKAAFPGITGFEDKLRQERAALSALRIRTLNAPDAYSQSLLNTATQTVRDRSAVIGDRVRLASLNDQLSAMTQALAHSASGEPSMGALRAERDASEAQFQTLSIALSNAIANSAQASAIGEAVVVDRATEARPTLISRGMLLALGMAIAVFFAIAAAYVSETTAPRLHNPADVERVYGKPSLIHLRAG